MDNNTPPIAGNDPATTPLPPVAAGGKKRLITIALILIIVLVIAGLAVYVNFMMSPVASLPVGRVTPQTVGTDIYNQAQEQNPIQNKLPETEDTIANPIGDAYVNPF